MRVIGDLLRSVIAEIPKDQSSLKEELELLLKDSAYTPPEMMWRRWEQGSRILEEHIPLPLPRWQKKVVEIWMGTKKEVEV